MADNIKVVVKVRPLVRREVDDGQSSLWSTGPTYIAAKSATLPTDYYHFDTVFDEKSTTNNVYEEVARPIVENALRGINGTIFAYGQTSSGKTYTMMGSKECPGIIPLAVDNIFKIVEEKKDRDFLLRVSFIEIYNDRIRDLLDITNTDLKVHEDYNGQIIIGSKEYVTTTPESVLDVMFKGNQNRSVGETLMNEKSSRSHSIFQITIESRQHVSADSEDSESVNVSQLNLVDLAGSERASSSGDNKGRAREGGHINKSLTTLSLVIRQLSEAQGDSNRYINYRDSKLTRILQSSLGGNAMTGIICTVTPAALEETHSTLKFAMCAKIIKNKPIVNAVVSDATQLKVLTKQIKTLQKDIENRRNLEEHNLELKEKIAQLQKMILMGSVAENKQRNTMLRRRTWCAPNLAPIAENPFPFTHRANELRLSQIGEASDMSIRTSVASLQSLVINKETLDDQVISLVDSDEENGCSLSPTKCSPMHKCYSGSKTPPCILKSRLKISEKELKELEEMTKLEQIYPRKEVELLHQIKSLNEEKFNHVEQTEALNSKVNELNATIDDLKQTQAAAEKNALQLKREVESLKLMNTDLEFQLETLQNNHKKRENDLIASLNEARNSKSTVGLKPIVDDQIVALESKNSAQIEALNYELKNMFESNESLEILLAEKQIFEERYKSEIERLQIEIDRLNASAVAVDPTLSYYNLDALMNESIKPEINIEFNTACERLSGIVWKADCDRRTIPASFDGKCKFVLECASLIEDVLKSNADKIVGVEAQLKEESDKLRQSIVDNENRTVRIKSELMNEFDERIAQYIKSDNEKNSQIESLQSRLAQDVLKESNKENNPLASPEIRVKVEQLTPLKSGRSKFKLETSFDTPKTTSLSKFVAVLRKNIKQITSDNSNEFSADLLDYVPELQLIIDRLKCVRDNADATKNDIGPLITEFKSTLTNFEGELKDLCNQINVDNSYAVEHDDSDDYSALESLHGIAKRIINLHRSALSGINAPMMRTDNLNASETKFTLMDAFNKIKELSFDSEELHKQLANQQNKQHVDNAEFRLYMSQLVSMDHYHKSVHNSCDSAIKYIRDGLETLQTHLLNGEEPPEAVDASYSADVSDTTMISELSTSVCAVDYKSLYDKIAAELETVTAERIKQIDTLECRIKTLECENDSLSSEIMDYVQEIDSLQTQLSKQKDLAQFKDIGLNTSVYTDSSKINEIVCNFNSGGDSISIDEFSERLKTFKEGMFKLTGFNYSLSIKLGADNELIEDFNKLKLEYTTILMSFYEMCHSILLSDEPFAGDKSAKVNMDLLPELISNLSLETSHRAIEDVTAYMEKIEQLESDLIVKQVLIERLECEALKSNEEMSELKERLKLFADGESEKITSLKSELKEKQDKIDDIEGRINDVTKGYEENINDLTQKLISISKLNKDQLDRENTASSKADELEEEIEVLRAAVRDNEDRLMKSCAENQQLVEQLKSADEKLSRVSDELKDSVLIKDLLEERLADLNGKIQSYDDNEIVLKKSINEKHNTIVKLEDEVVHLKNATENLENELNNKKIDLKNLSEKYEEVVSSLGKFDEASESLKIELDRCKEERTVLQIECADLRSKIELINILVKSKDENISALTADLNTKKTEYESDNNRLKEELESFKIERKESNEKIAELSVKFNSLLASVAGEDSNKTVESIDDVLNLIKSSYFECKEKLRIETENSVEIASRLDKIQIEHGIERTALVESHRRMQDSVKNSLIDILNVNADGFNVEDAISAVKNEIVNYRAIVLDLTENNNSEKNKIENDLADVKRKLNQISEEYDGLKSHVNELLRVFGAENIENLVGCFESLKSEKDDLSKLLQSNDSLMKKLQNDINEYKRGSESLFREKCKYLADVELKNKECEGMQVKIKQLEEQLSELEAKSKDGLNLGVGGRLMDFVVDKMTYDALKDKNEQLLKEKEDLRTKHKSLMLENRRLQQTIQNNTVSNFLPNDRENINALKEQVRGLAEQLTALKDVDKLYKDLQVKFGELDEECEMCAKQLTAKEEDCRTLYTQNKILETRVMNLEMEMSEFKNDSRETERRKKRRSLLDISRGNISNESPSKSIEISEKLKIAEMEKEISEHKVKIADLMNHFKQVCEEKEELRARLTEALDQIQNPTNAALPSISGSAIVTNQKLCEYIEENKRLNDVNAKLKIICRKRAKEIKELNDKYMNQ